MKTAIERLAKAVGYPERVPDGALSFAFRVDGEEILAEEENGRVVLSRVLSDDAAVLQTLAQYAVGRMLKEDASLTFGRPGLSAFDLGSSSFIWQDAPADADSGALCRLFESFLDSCDWWRARVDALHGGAASESEGGEMMMIRP